MANENRWSPFDPEWYQQAFDKFISTADQLFNQDDIIQQGYHIPDADGSKSSIFRNNSVLNNSFNEKALRETLKDIYLNSTHKLVASNHDTVQFFQYATKFSKIECSPNTMMCQFVIPSDKFFADNREMFKFSQFYRKWISIQDILNNWQTFKWAYLIFVNQRIYSEYEIRIDDHEVTVRFPYYEHWLTNDYPIYIYKFETNAQCRMQITQHYLTQCNYQIPISDITDQRICNSKHIIAVLNRINDSSIRTDGMNDIDVVSDNIEFVSIHDGILDLSGISDYNKNLVLSEFNQPIWLSLIVPKFFHEYPIVLPTDVVFRPYIFDMTKVSINDNGDIKHAMIYNNETNEYYHVYANEDGHINEHQDGWKYLIRPMVLSDAYKEDLNDPYEEIGQLLYDLKEMTIKAADLVEQFRFDQSNMILADEVSSILTEIHTYHNNYLRDHKMELNETYDIAFARYQKAMQQVIETGNTLLMFTDPDTERDQNIWTVISPCIYMPRELCDRYNVAIMIAHASRHGNLMSNINDYKNQIRFTRPIDINDIWTFEYDIERDVWRPYMLNVERHFPDVYTLTDPNETTPTPDRIFKAFIFYSDNINVTKQSVDIVDATASWDHDMEQFMYDRGGVYRDIFMEKFYWMGINAIYRGTIQTKFRWELIEYIIDNNSYERFNELFLRSMEPYFKLGLATYLKSDNFEFPFDDAIAKMQESINQQFIGYQKITNYEMYLNKTWIPSYFDYIISIMDNYNPEEIIVHRPRTTFDISRLLPSMINIQSVIQIESDKFKNTLNWIVDQLNNESYGLNIDLFNELQDRIDDLVATINNVYTKSSNLDMDIYSNNDINTISVGLQDYLDIMNNIHKLCETICGTATVSAKYQQKRDKYDSIKSGLNEISINAISMKNISSNIDTLISLLIDPESRVINDITNPRSIIGYINGFTSIWTEEVQIARNNLYLSTVAFNSKYHYDSEFSMFAFNTWIDDLENVRNHLLRLESEVNTYFETHDIDQILIDKIDYVNEYISAIFAEIGLTKQSYDLLNISLDKYITVNKNSLITGIGVSDLETKYLNDIAVESHQLLKYARHFFIEYDQNIFNNHLNKMNEYIDKLIEFNDFEKLVFDTVYDSTNLETGFVPKVNIYNSTITQMIVYMDTVNDPYIPDTNSPDYANIYQISEIEIINGGFDNNIGEMVFIPNLGTYQITSVDNGAATAVNVFPSRNTTFRNPLWQGNNEYDSVTSGIGLGITIKPLSVDTIVLIDDTMVDSYISRIGSCITELYINLNKYNPRVADVECNVIIENIETIKSEWTTLIEKYEQHISPDLMYQVSDLISSISDILPMVNDFNDNRNNIKPEVFLSLFNQFMNKCYTLYDEKYGIDPHYKLYDDRMRVAYNAIASFIGNGSSWADIDQLIVMMDNSLNEIDLFKRMVLQNTDFIDEVTTLIDDMIGIRNDAETNKSWLDANREKINDVLDSIVIFLNDITSDRIVDSWYQIISVTVAEAGHGYAVGDIVEIIPELPVNYKGEIDHSNEDIIMNDKIYIQIKQVTSEGAVIKADMLINNTALPYALNGSRYTSALFGNGNGFKAYIHSIENDLENSALFLNTATSTSINQYNENDLIKYVFANTHNLSITYEVFLAGKQITDFHVRSENIDGRDVDAVYVNANEVMNLQNSSVYTKGEHYYTYKLERLEIVDPGAGYSVDQTIWVQTDSIPLKLIVTELDGTPFNGIKSVEFAENKSTYADGNPSSAYAEAITDSMNNIDDEYSGGYYDILTQDGITKPATITYGDEFMFTSKRFDDLLIDDRNANYMYPEIDSNKGNGDPDHGWYQGKRLNEIHKWCGIENVIPIKDPISSDNVITPIGQPKNAEFQFICRDRIHNSSEEVIPTLKPIPAEIIEAIVAGTAEANASSEFLIDDNVIIGIPNIEIEGMYDGSVVGEVNDPLPCDDGEIVGIGVSTVNQIMYGKLTPTVTPIYIDDQMMSSDITAFYAVTFINKAMQENDFIVDTYEDIPKHISQWKDAHIGDAVIVLHDETHNGHRMVYRLRTFSGVKGYFVYERPEIADFKWTSFNVDWMNTNFYPDYPTLKGLYPNAPWNTANKFTYVENNIDDGKTKSIVSPIKYLQTYIHDVTIDDLSVYNHTMNRWEDLSSGWELVVRNNDNDYGFELKCLYEGAYSYDMSLYLNKKPSNQIRNASLKRNAVFDISAVIDGEINNPSVDSPVDTGRHLRIRKLFPYTQITYVTIGKNLGYNMDIIIDKYPHYRNELHLEDIQLYNITAGRFENVLDPKRFEIQFKDEKAVARGKETQTKIIQHMISNAGNSFVDGEVWGYNADYNTHVFGQITTNHDTGEIITFTPIHVVNPPSNDVMIDFNIYQNYGSSDSAVGTVIIEFQTNRSTVYGDGYIHNVQNRLAPLPKEFRIVCLYNLEEPTDYGIIISTTPKVWKFVMDKDIVFPVFHIPDQIIPQDHIYIIGNNGRYPLINPSTGKPSITVTHTDTGTDVQFLNLYYAYDHIEIHYTPYPMRSIYTQRRVPSSGYIDLTGKINKPLNKKYFEFWMNGRLLHDEVTIITPTKLFIHGAKSLRNFEIIEINRDSNEFFADTFLEVSYSDTGIPSPYWNLTTYLDDTLSGTLDGENYTKDEQALLLTPVYPQVSENHIEFRNYPPNMDTENDILLKVDEDFSAVSDAATSYQYTVVDTPTIEGISINERTLKFSKFGFRPITEDMLINMMNEEWAKEMESGLLPTHTVISDAEWYGLLARLYDANGVQVHTLAEAAYKIIEPNMLRINDDTKLVRITRNPVTYDLN